MLDPAINKPTIPTPVYGSENPNKLITDIEMADLIGCARSTVWKWVSDGIIPKPLKIGGMSRWKLSEAYDVISRADAEREAA